LGIYGRAHLHTMNPDTICTAFQKTRIWPLDPSCYGYRVYIPYITYPLISTRTFDIESLHHSTYFLTYSFILCSTIKTQKLLFYLLHFS
jgi:hypothetical protein